MATLDKRTSEICQKKDHKVYAVKERSQGVNCPPMHPFCRSTTIAYLDDETISNMERLATDDETGEKNIIPVDLTYKDWSDRLNHKAFDENNYDLMGAKKNFILKITPQNSKKISLYECSEYRGIYWQNATENTKKLTNYYIKNRNGLEEGIGTPKNIVIINDKTFDSFGAYDKITDTIYLNEKIIDRNAIKKISKDEYFASNTTYDIIRHELHHKEHYDAVKRFYKANQKKYNSIEDAKHDLEQELYSYLNKAVYSEPQYLMTTISGYADYAFDCRNINEIIAEACVKNDNQELTDDILKKLVMEVLGYANDDSKRN